ncbi:hypothetical protein [Cysteiniphilum litorale]|uniref:hypothetical protein n=1 Tax=Cysteiniphilum litorale TaxID=2056700 RepID=UPI003F881801
MKLKNLIITFALSLVYSNGMSENRNVDMYNACTYNVGIRSNFTDDELPLSKAAYNLAAFNDPSIKTCKDAKNADFDSFQKWKQKIINSIELMKLYDDYTDRSLYLIEYCQPHGDPDPYSDTFAKCNITAKTKLIKNFGPLSDIDAELATIQILYALEELPTDR